MGHIIMSAREFVSAVGEMLGIKSGLALTAPELRRLLRGNPSLLRSWPKRFDSLLRINSVYVEELIAWLLYRVGNIETPTVEIPILTLSQKYKKDSEKLALLERVSDRFDI